MSGDRTTLLVFVTAAVSIGLIALLVSRALASPEPKRAGEDEPDAGAPEPGPRSSAAQWASMLLGVVFAVQAVLLYAWASALASGPTHLLVIMLVFLGITAVGLLYASRRGGGG